MYYLIFIVIIISLTILIWYKYNFLLYDIIMLTNKLMEEVRLIDTSTWIAIYLPLLIIFLVVIPNQQKFQKLIIKKIKKRKGVITMTNEIIKKYIGTNCKISTGSYGTNIIGTILEINENWIEVQTKKGKELINSDFVQNIKVK